jgi:hypothetical protein
MLAGAVRPEDAKPWVASACRTGLVKLSVSLATDTVTTLERERPNWHVESGLLWRSCWQRVFNERLPPREIFTAGRTRSPHLSAQDRLPNSGTDAQGRNCLTREVAGMIIS